MAKKALKTQMRKIKTRATVEKKANARMWGTTKDLYTEEWSTEDHLNYEDLNTYLNLPERITGEL